MSPPESCFHEIASALTGATAGKLFGKLCYMVHGKPFVSFFDDAMVFKLQGDTHAEALSLPESRLFDPSGKNRHMKEWVQVAYTEKDTWSVYARAAADYVTRLHA